MDQPTLNLHLSILGSIIATSLNITYKINRQPVRVISLDICNPQTQAQIVNLEACAYRCAEISPDEIEAANYFANFALGLRTTSTVHLGIIHLFSGELIGYLSFFQPAANQWVITPPGELVFDQCLKQWQNLGCPHYPIVVYRKMLRHPLHQRLIFRSKALRVSLALMTFLIGTVSSTDWILISKAQPDSIAVLRKGINEMFYNTQWIVDEITDHGRSRITMCFFESLRGRQNFRRLIKTLGGILVFAKIAKKKHN